jgi:hypothetical protein
VQIIIIIIIIIIITTTTTTTTTIIKIISPFGRKIYCCTVHLLVGISFAVCYLDPSDAHRCVSKRLDHTHLHLHSNWLFVLLKNLDFAKLKGFRALCSVTTFLSDFSRNVLNCLLFSQCDLIKLTALILVTEQINSFANQVSLMDMQWHCVNSLCNLIHAYAYSNCVLLKTLQ